MYTGRPILTADEIKNIRERSGLTQSQFAARLKVAVTTVSRWECGTGRPGLRSIQKIRRIERRLNNSSVA